MVIVVHRQSLFVSLHDFFFLSFTFHLGINSVLYDLAFCRHDPLVCVGCVHPSYAEAGSNI